LTWYWYLLGFYALFACASAWFVWVVSDPYGHLSLKERTRQTVTYGVFWLPCLLWTIGELLYESWKDYRWRSK